MLTYSAKREREFQDAGIKIEKKVVGGVASWQATWDNELIAESRQRGNVIAAVEHKLK